MTAEERARWNLLGDLVFEDIYSLWEVITRVEGEVAEQVIGGLIADGLLEVFVVEKDDPNTSAQTAPRVATDEVLRLIRARSMEARTVQWWVAPTDQAVAVLGDPPQEVRDLWCWPEGFSPFHDAPQPDRDCDTGGEQDSQFWTYACQFGALLACAYVLFRRRRRR